MKMPLPKVMPKRKQEKPEGSSIHPLCPRAPAFIPSASAPGMMWRPGRIGVHLLHHTFHKEWWLDPSKPTQQNKLLFLYNFLFCFDFFICCFFIAILIILLTFYPESRPLPSTTPSPTCTYLLLPLLSVFLLREGNSPMGSTNPPWHIKDKQD